MTFVQLECILTFLVELDRGSRRKHDRGNNTQLLSNESLEVHAKTLWCSDNRWTVCKLLGCNDAGNIEEALNQQWECTSPKVKLKYFSRARYALLDEDKHSMRSSRRSTEKMCKKEEDDSVVYSEALRRTVPVPAPVKNLSDLDRFIRLKPNKQRDILKRWLKFYQKMLSRRDYSNFLIDFEQALYRSRLDDLKSAPTHRLKSNDVELNHRRILFNCMKRIKTQIITNCSEKYLIRRTELDKQYSDIVWALLNDDSSNLVPGCRSNRLKDTLNDLLELEEGGHVDVRGQAVQTESYTCILNDLNTNEHPIDKQNTDILSDLPEVQNLELYEQVLENLASHKELTSLTTDVPDIDCEVPCRNVSDPQHKDGASNTPDPLDHSYELIENNIREILHQEAIDAFIRSNESSTRSCCDLDSPSCILSMWISAEYNSLPNLLASSPKNDDAL
ncbi:hypothetical protein LOTGIDRAFT_229834 [Lottia gigantea]|uniref:Uncharacterized protein n=1 Tax=Lottia gigantea TaxID=225164 RepID=V3ZKD7_LOTGI|nr:hypothetical protein LOTGIDRAFT_229834 [Lottia gigantea]ESO82830.1 hypothetical protein LOTGIDRAFT_229834 [Lottia gigantea]